MRTRFNGEGVDKLKRDGYTVRAVWDREAKVWVATSDDVPGLATEAPTRKALETKLRTLVPELLELNGEPLPRGRRIPLHLVSERSKDLTMRVCE